LNIVCWFWGKKYSLDYVRKLAAGLKRNIKQPYRFAVISEGGQEKVDGAEAWVMKHPELIPSDVWPNVGGVRMQLFDTAWQEELGIIKGNRIVSMDIDTVVTGQLDVLFNRPEPFTILQGINTTNPNPFNGSLWTVQAGYRPDAWTDFTLEAFAKLSHHQAKPSEQDWMFHKFPDAAAWGPQDGVYGFKKRGWVGGMEGALPDNAVLVTFPGRDPAKYVEVPWIKKYWKL